MQTFSIFLVIGVFLVDHLDVGKLYPTVELQIKQNQTISHLSTVTLSYVELWRFVLLINWAWNHFNSCFADFNDMNIMRHFRKMSKYFVKSQFLDLLELDCPV